MVGEHILTYTVERAEFAGGAHGMEQTHHANWNLLTGERLSLDDLFTPEGKAALAEAIRAQIIEDKGVTSWQELAEGQCFNPETEVTATENFALTASDITFVYNPYDIACYAAGATHVKLPLANLPGFRKEIL
jgi:hypothetical protein